jgi:hypothetical protein
METPVRLSNKPKKRSISIRGLEEEFHMMLVWDKCKPKPPGFLDAYTEMSKELLDLLEKNNYSINFTPMYLGPNSTYGQVDDWLTSYIYKCRDSYNWLNLEKDLSETVEKQTDTRFLFAHISRRELKEGSTLLGALRDLEPVVIKVKFE